jgi:hypothetical protein
LYYLTAIRLRKSGFLDGKAREDRQTHGIVQCVVESGYKILVKIVMKKLIMPIQNLATAVNQFLIIFDGKVSVKMTEEEKTVTQKKLHSQDGSLSPGDDPDFLIL